MGEKIRLEMGDWLYNAGLVGMINIFQHSEDDFKLTNQFVEFDLDVLENFEEKYFNYFIDKYEKLLSWYKITSYEDMIFYHENSNLENFQEKDLEILNDHIKNVKHYLKSASYKAAYPLIGTDFDPIERSKEINTIKLKKKEKIEDKHEDIQKVFNQLKAIIDFCKRSVSRKYLAGKNVIYTIIRNAWEGVCFLYRQTKEKDMYIDYKKYFVEPVGEYIQDDKKNYKYDCFVCDRKIKNLNNDLSFLNNIGFDVSRKPSHVWNFNNDVAVCPICKLVYSCVPAGITYVYDQGIFINENTNLKNMTSTNNRIKSEILQETQFNKDLTYRSLINAIHEQANQGAKYELQDIQVIKYENGQYRFSILSRKVLNIINQSRTELDSIINSVFKEVNTYFSIYDLVIDRILNSQNLFTLIHKLLVYKLSSPKNCRFSIQQVIKVLNINLKIMEGMGYVENINKDIIKQANSSGYYLRTEYKNRGAKDKLNGISYRFLNALKTNNKNMFMDTLLNCYLYVQKTVPNIFLSALKDEEQFKTIGYAFVAGLIEGKNYEKKNGGDE